MRTPSDRSCDSTLRNPGGQRGAQRRRSSPAPIATTAGAPSLFTTPRGGIATTDAQRRGHRKAITAKHHDPGSPRHRWTATRPLQEDTAPLSLICAPPLTNIIMMTSGACCPPTWKKRESFFVLAYRPWWCSLPSIPVSGHKINNEQ